LLTLHFFDDLIFFFKGVFTPSAKRSNAK